MLIPLIKKICKIGNNSKYADNCKIGIHLTMLMRKTGIPYCETQEAKGKMRKAVFIDQSEKNQPLLPNLSTRPSSIFGFAELKVHLPPYYEPSEVIDSRRFFLYDDKGADKFREVWFLPKNHISNHLHIPA